jgi:tetratricopeptide (TPR) repeat protein
MRITKGIVLFTFIACTVCSCQKKINPKETFAKVGKIVFSQKDFKHFQTMQSEYPTMLSDVFPGPNRSAATAFVEAEAIAQTAGRTVENAVESSADWRWKTLFFQGQLYLKNVLSMTLGFTDQEMKSYYDSHREEFKMVFKVPVKSDSSAQTVDTTKKVEPQMRDSIEYSAFESVKNQISRQLFLAKYPPPAEMYKSRQAASDSTAQPVDSAMVKEQWFSTTRADLPQFFMKKYYEEKYGKPFPDSLKEWYGPNKTIQPADFDVILSWLPPDRRESYKDPSGTSFLAQWLLKWLLFSEKAQKNGFAAQDANTQIIRWAKRYEIANKYINQTLVPLSAKNIQLDTAMCTYAFWDNETEPGTALDSVQKEQALTAGHTMKKMIALDSLIYSIRTQCGVTFYQSDFKDDKGDDPKIMMTLADSLLNAGESARAEEQYNKIVLSRPFTSEGKQALLELAKIYSESEKYRQAISNYRKYLMIADDQSKMCNTFFMIGFVFDEYLDDAKHAAINYQWILKNEPKCELADDAEFMYLHLGEPMIGVEELQAEAKRQGRKMDETQPVGETIASDTASAAKL